MAGYDMTYPTGMKQKGTLDSEKPIAMVKNDDGSTSTIRTISVGYDDGEYLIPTVHPDGYIMSDDEARARFEETGEHFGVFNSPIEASDYAEALHKNHSKFVK